MRTMLSNDTKCGRSTDSGTCFGLIWFIGWLFTIGSTGLPFWRAVLGLIFWPYFLGAALKQPVSVSIILLSIPIE